MALGRLHTEDADCTLDPGTDRCTICGVFHDQPCQFCGGRGFHKPGCRTQALEPEPDFKALLLEAYAMGDFAGRVGAPLARRIAKALGIDPELNGYDYKHQAWVRNGVYMQCGHAHGGYSCNCWGWLHAGEPVAADAEVH